MNTYFVLILAGVCFLIGVIVAYLLQTLREEKKPAEQESPPTNIDEEPAMDKLPPTPYDLVEVARIWKDKFSQNPVLEMGGDLYRKAEDLHPAQVEKLNTVFYELMDWLGQPIPAGPTTDATPAFLGDDPFHPFTTAKPPRRGPLEILKNSLEADIRSAIKTPPKSLAAQVDEILQEKLAQAGMEDRGIRIMDTPSADLVVMVGLSKYDGLEAVPDADIQSLIREAVAEWGKRVSQDTSLAN